MTTEEHRVYSDDGKRLALIDLTNRAPQTKASKRRFVMIFIDTEHDPTLDRGLSNFQHRLLMFLIRRMNESNEVRLLQSEIAADLKKHSPDISKALKALREGGYLSTPHTGVIRIDPQVAWKSSLAENAEALKHQARD